MDKWEINSEYGNAFMENKIQKLGLNGELFSKWECMKLIQDIGNKSEMAYTGCPIIIVPSSVHLSYYGG